MGSTAAGIVGPMERPAVMSHKVILRQNSPAVSHQLLGIGISSHLRPLMPILSKNLPGCYFLF